MMRNFRNSRLLFAAILAGLCLAGGCANRNAAAPTTQMATDIDPELAKPQYWLDRPAIATVRDAEYQRLFDECEHALRMRYFNIDRREFRSGLLTSKPLISQQFWEFWRHDVGNNSEKINSSLATYRRTVYWTVERQEDGGFVASPKVVIERYSADPTRITSVTNYRGAALSAQAQTQLDSPSLSAVPVSTWYAVGRDEALERKMVDDVTQRLTAE